MLTIRTCRRLVVATGTLLLLFTGAAQATPIARLTVPAQSDAGRAIPYSWSVQNKPKAMRLAIERQVGTSKTWKTVAELHDNTGSGSYPAQALGRPRIRLAVYGKRKGATKRSLLKTAEATLHVFGPVSLGTLLDRDVKAQSTPTATFSYVFDTSLSAFDDDRTRTAFTIGAAQNRCRSAHIDFLMDSGERNPGVTGIVSLVQEARDPTTVPWATQVVGGFDAAFAPGKSWGIVASYNRPANTDDFYTVYVYLNGVASCDSAASVEYG